MLNLSLTRRKKNWLGHNFTVILTLAAFISAILTYVVITSSAAPLGIKPRRVLTLLSIDIVLLMLLSATVGSRLYKLWAGLRARSGSQLQRRILLLFGLVTILPTIVVSISSAAFFNLGIQTWFNERVQTAFDESLAVAEAYLDEHKENIRGDALAMADDLNRVADMALTDPQEFNRIVTTQSALRVLTESIVFQGSHIIAQGPLSFALAFERLPQDALERAGQGEVVLMTAEDDKVRALVKLSALDNTYLLVGRLIDSKVLMHMKNTQGAVNEYNTLKSQLDRLENAFSVLFVMLTLLLLLGSVSYGIRFAAQLTTPIAGLVAAAERVRAGDFSARVETNARSDELGTLSRAFNRMTEQLEAQRGQLIEANRRLDERRRFSEAVLSGVSAGVIALDHEKRVTLPNRSAIAILSAVGQPITDGMHISEILPGIQELILSAEQMPGEVAQSTLTLDKGGSTLTLHVRITVERMHQRIEGFIVTFDDITLLVAAQRNAAWADVARRVAHEIKNPLTPIQLAAERLRRKYLKYITEDQDTFIKYTDTITRHVGDISRMVEEFVSFARLPTPQFTLTPLDGILKKAVFSAKVGHNDIEYGLEIPPIPIALDCDERQLTQVLTNLLKNAAESIETRLARGHDEPGRINVHLSRTDAQTFITVEDNGIGFPAGEIQKMLEPYVTTRSKGTGLGLAIVKKIIEDHNGRITLENISDGGARVILSFLPHCDINAAT